MITKHAFPSTEVLKGKIRAKNDTKICLCLRPQCTTKENAVNRNLPERETDVFSAIFGILSSVKTDLSHSRFHLIVGRPHGSIGEVWNVISPNRWMPYRTDK